MQSLRERWGGCQVNEEQASEHRHLQAGKQGDAAALERLLSVHYDALYSLCRGMLSHSEDAEDAVQETLIRALRSLARFRGESGVRTIRVEYVPTGRYVWNPRSALITSGDAESKLPLISAATAEAALAAAQKFDPQSTMQNIHRTRGVLAVTIVYKNGQMWSFGKPMNSY